VCTKLVALCINQFPRSSSRFQKGWWPLCYTINIWSCSSHLHHMLLRGLSEKVLIRVANSPFLKLDFEILAFFEHLWLFLEIKKARQTLVFSGFFQSWLWKSIDWAAYSLKNSSEKSITMAACTKHRKDFTVALKLIDFIHKKQMCDNVITGKVNASKEWNCIVSMFLTSFNVSFGFAYAYFIC